MEATQQAENLTREEILNVLQQRHLHISGMHFLTHDELVRVYNAFVLPLSRRPQKHKLPVHQNEAFRHQSCYVENGQLFIMEKESNVKGMAMDVDVPADSLNSIREKRRTANDDMSDLSKATKRIRLESSFKGTFGVEVQRVFLDHRS